LQERGAAAAAAAAAAATAEVSREVGGAVNLHERVEGQSLDGKGGTCGGVLRKSLPVDLVHLWVQGLEFRVQSLGFWVPGFGFWNFEVNVWGFGFRV